MASHRETLFLQGGSAKSDASACLGGRMFCFVVCVLLSYMVRTMPHPCPGDGAIHDDDGLLVLLPVRPLSLLCTVVNQSTRRGKGEEKKLHCMVVV